MTKSNCCDKRLPGVPTLISNAAATLASSIRHFVGTGVIAASDEQVKKRQASCDTCDKKRGDRCLECGCFIQLKIALEAAKCPKGRW